MNLAGWNPIREMSTLQNHFNRLFDDARHNMPVDDAISAWAPAADICENENELILQADLPGLDPKQIDIRVENNVLTIRGERHLERNFEGDTFHRIERSFGKFVRSFTLSTSVDGDKIRASYKNGVLTVTLPKAEQAKPKRIQIAAAAAMFLAVALLSLMFMPAVTLAAADETYVWNGELVALDQKAHTITVKSMVVGNALDEFKNFKPGDRVLLGWSGFDKYANAINHALRFDAGKKLENRFMFPAEFVAFDAPTRYATFKAQIPADGVAKIQSLKPGEWVTATSPHGASSENQPIVSIKPYVGSAASTN